MTAAARRAGLSVPHTELATDEALSAVSRTIVLKSRSHAQLRSETLVSSDIDELRAAARAMRARGAEPLLQEHVTGQLVAVSVVMGNEGRVLAAVQQRAMSLWPPEAGVSVFAKTVEIESDLVDLLTSFLASIGWRGLAEAQFLDSARGPLLIDVNGRCYGSMALAAAAGVDLAAIWATAATIGDVVAPRARSGMRYQWLYGDLRSGWRTGRQVMQPLMRAWKSTHSVWDLRDPYPSMAYLRILIRSALRRRDA
nr:ATP-grasp domain-containing protein [Nocardioides luti]